MVDIIEILVHWHAGRNNSEIAQSLGVDRKTVRKYAAAAEAAGMRPGGPLLSEAEWDARVRAWFPELADTRLRQVTWPAIEPHQEFIRGQLKAGGSAIQSEAPQVSSCRRLRSNAKIRAAFRS